MGKSNKLFYALLAGAAAGVAIGMFLASDKNSETKKKLADGAKKLADDILGKAEDVIDKMSDKQSNV